MQNEMRELAVLLDMPKAELQARHNAWREVQIAGRALLAAIERGDMSVTSPEVAEVASRVLAMGPEETNDPDLLTAAKALAGSALSQFPGDQEQLPLEEATAKRALADAQRTHQADPLTRTVAIGPDTIGPKGE